MCNAACALLITTLLSVGINFWQLKLLNDADKKYLKLMCDYFKLYRKYNFSGSTFNKAIDDCIDFLKKEYASLR